MHNLELVPLAGSDLAETRPRHDLQVALDRHLGGLEAQLQCEIGDADPLGHATVRAIDPDRYGPVQATVPGWRNGAGVI